MAGATARVTPYLVYLPSVLMTRAFILYLYSAFLFIICLYSSSPIVHILVTLLQAYCRPSRLSLPADNDLKHFHMFHP